MEPPAVDYMCYYSQCHYTSSDINTILYHSISQHNGTSKFSIRKRVLDEKSGHVPFKSHHFPLQISQISDQITKGFKPYINSEHMKIAFKRRSSDAKPEREYIDEAVQTPEEDIYALIPDVIESLRSMKRLEDFKSTLIALINGHLFNNIAFHLLLDVGNFFSQSAIHNNRYSEETILFWLTIQKLFKGKGINFFRGYKGQGLNSESIKPEECQINFAVPSDPILCKHSAKYTLDAAKPGLLDLSMNIVSEKLKGKDVKLSIDGKKLASGFGKLGDEDLGGHETAPTLNERKIRLDTERTRIEAKKNIVKKAICDGKNTVNEIDAVNRITIKNAFLVSITNLSKRVKELRELIVKRKQMVLNLMKQVSGDWKTSKVAPAISFSQTKIIQSQEAIVELLDCIDKIGFTVACLNGTEKNYVLGNKTTIHLDQQSNYICLRNLTDVSLNNEQDATITKQRSDEWLKLREKSRVTGSTLYKGLGLGTLKDQQTHYDKVYQGKEAEISKELQDLFDYGTKQEINALGTLLGKIMPVYFPNLTYKEDGCEVIPLNDSYAVISGDGSGMDPNHSNEVAFEFKCPKPGKQRTTDVHYALPKYYSAQVLSQMFAKKSNSFTYISFTPESTVFIDGKMDFDLWEDLWRMAEEIYKKDAKRPTRRHEKRSETLQKVNDFVNSCHFVAEFPSLRSIPCYCPPASSKKDVFFSHRREEYDRDNYQIPLQDTSIVLEKCSSVLDQAYNILRKPAKEVLLTVLSDLERNATIDNTFAHAIPIQCCLSGFSLTMLSVRKILKDAVSACIEKDLYVKAIAFDGQFLEISVEDDKGTPLTVLRFMKKFWEKVQHIDKVEKLSHLIRLNNLPSIQSQQDLMDNFDIQGNNIGLKLDHKVVASGINISKALDKKNRQNESAQEDKESECTTDNEMYLLQYLPREIVTEMDEDALHMLREAGKAMTENTQLNEPVTDHADVPDFKPQQIDFEAALISLIAFKNPETESIWESYSIANFKDCFASAIKINQSFKVEELKVILSLTCSQKTYNGMLKAKLVNLVSSIYGDKSTIAVGGKQPKCLKNLVSAHIRKWPVDAINVAFAQSTFGDAFEEWNSSNPFQGNWTIKTESGKLYEIHQWYAQPSMINDQYIQPIIDPHHLFVNNRARCCSKGLTDMAIHPEACWRVARKEKENKTGLSWEIAKELRDRQRNSFAQTTFSESVQRQMELNGDLKAARWCELLRHWYHAIDNASVSLDTRIEWLLDMRQYLLLNLKVGHFPPPGSYVSSLPIAQFEGILSNIDRRLQLYSMTKNGTYYQRSISSLDSETFFSAFQDYDPKGTGVLRPDDIPTALGSAVCLFRQRLDANRKFVMKTSRKVRVYQEHCLSYIGTGNCEDLAASQVEKNCIELRSHPFDMPARKTKTPKRKSGTITSFGEPSKGAEGCRSYHKSNEEKILPHRRYGLMDNEIDLLSE